MCKHHMHTHQNMHPNRVGHVVPFVRMSWICCCAATKPSNFGMTETIVAICLFLWSTSTLYGFYESLLYI